LAIGDNHATVLEFLIEFENCIRKIEGLINKWTKNTISKYRNRT